MEALGAARRSSKEIAAATGIRVTYVYEIMQRLENKKLVDGHIDGAKGTNGQALILWRKR